MIAYALASTLIECCANVSPPVPPIAFWGRFADEQFFRARNPQFRPNFEWFFEPNPGAEFCGGIINEDGYRGRVFTKEKTARNRILTLGDSSTMGFGVPDRECWPRVLESLLRAAGKDAEVVNLGCVGFSAYQGELLFKGKGQYYHPDIVITAFGAINESFPCELGVDQHDKARILATKSYQINRFLDRFLIFRWLKGPRPIYIGSHAKEEKTPNLSPAQFEEAILNIVNIQRAAGLHCVVVNPPRRVHSELDHPTAKDYTETIYKITKDGSIPLADVYKLFRSREPEYSDRFHAPPGDAWYLDSVHPSAAGHAKYAELVANVLLEHSFLR